MAVNKNFPNYKKPVLSHTVIRSAAGPNRSSRRKDAAQKRAAPSWRKKIEAEMHYKEGKDSRAAKVERRVKRATTRRMEREEAKKKGVPVKYSIK